MQLYIEVLGAGIVLHTPTKQSAITGPEQMLKALGELPDDGTVEKPPHGVALEVTKIENGWRCEVERNRLLVLVGDEGSATRLYEVLAASGGPVVQAKRLHDQPGDDSEELDVAVGPVKIRATRGDVRAGGSLIRSLFGLARSVSVSKKEKDELEARRARKRLAEIEARAEADIAAARERKAKLAKETEG